LKAFEKIPLLLLICITLNSCASFKHHQIRQDQTYLNSENIHLLNGSFQNNKKNTPRSYFWGSYITTKYFDVLRKIKDKTILVNLKVLNNKKIEVKIVADNTVLKSYVIKGKIKKGYFEQRRKLYLIPALLYNEYHNSKFRIGLLNDNNIVSDFKNIEFGTVYFVQPFNSGYSNSDVIHERILK